MVRNPKNIGRNLLSALCLIGILVFSANLVSAKTLARYKEDVQHLKRDFASLISENTDAEFEGQVLAEIPELLPPEEKIDLDGTTVGINNEWLTGYVKKYREATDPKEKRLILLAIYERLDAVELKIEEFEAAAQSNISKDEQKRRLAEILGREEYQKPVQEESLLERFLNWLDKWLNSNVPAKPLPVTPGNFGGVAYILQIGLYALLAGLIAFLIYKFAPFLIGKYRQRERTNTKERIILGEKIAANASSGDLFSEAEKSAVEGNLREAIRKGYIAFLFELSERRLIGLAKYKTNRDYLRAVRKKRGLYQTMNGLTSNYERHWYGFEDTHEKDWEEFKQNYREALEEQ